MQQFVVISRGAEGPGREILQRPPSVMGVCCIVFEIDGMLFEFFMNFLNIDFFVSIFHVFFAFHAISNIKKNIWCKKNPGGGGGVEFLLEKQFFLISRFMLFSTLKNIEKCPFTYWLNGCGFSK